MVRWGSPETPSHKQTNDYEISWCTGMKILLAKDAGYCFGVRDAVNMAYDTANEYDEVYMLGDIVHNETVVRDLAKAGTKVVTSLNNVPKDKPVLFRAHGTDPNVWNDAKEKNLNIIDATCPLVIEIHEEIKKLEAEGRKTIIIGDHGHDEVVAIAAQVSDPIIKKILETHDSRTIHGMVHCSGGAQTKILHFIDQLHVIKDNMFEVPPLFKLIQQQSKTHWKEMYQVFNCGHRMELYVAAEVAETMIATASEFNVAAQVIGRVECSENKKLTIKTEFGNFEY